MSNEQLGLPLSQIPLILSLGLSGISMDINSRRMAQKSRLLGG